MEDKNISIFLLFNNNNDIRILRINENLKLIDIINNNYNKEILFYNVENSKLNCEKSFKENNIKSGESLIIKHIDNNNINESMFKCKLEKNEIKGKIFISNEDYYEKIDFIDENYVEGTLILINDKILTQCIGLEVGLKSIKYIFLFPQETMINTFEKCELLIRIDLSDFNYHKLTNIANVFDECYNLLGVVLPNNMILDKVESCVDCFNLCRKLKQISNLENIQIPNAYNLIGNFNCCESLQNITLNFFNCSKKKSFNSLFQYCRNLRNLKLCFGLFKEEKNDKKNNSNNINNINNDNTITNVKVSINDECDFHDFLQGIRTKGIIYYPCKLKGFKEKINTELPLRWRKIEI